MRKRFVLILLFIASVFSVNAQEKLLTLDDVIAGGANYFDFYPETIWGLSWQTGSDNYTFTESDSLMIADAKKGKSSLLFTARELSEITGSTFKRIPKHQWIDTQVLLLISRGTYFYVDVKKKELIEKISISNKGRNNDLNIESRNVAYTVDNNLYVATPSCSKITVTADSEPTIVNGQTYHRSEFGIHKGTFWSPNGNLLAFSRKDESMVTEYPIVNVMTRVASEEAIRYPMAGMDIHHVTIGVFDVKSGKTVFLKTGEPVARYFTTIAWSPDETTVYVAEINREQNHMQLNSYNAQTGEFIKTLFEEKSDKYTEPQEPMTWLPGNSDQFLWKSNRSGHDHYYIYSSEGELVRQLTSGNWDIISNLGFDESSEHIFLSTTEKSPIERHTYRVNIASGERTCLTNESGTHNVQVSSTGNYILDNWSNLTTPRVIDIVATSNLKTRNLVTAANPYDGYKLGDLSQFTIKSADEETDLYCNMILPVDFDETKKYPVIVYVYGGPHAQLVHNAFMGSARKWQYYMAQKGYISFTVDNRGSANRGRDFEQVIHRQLGVAEMADQMKGIEFLSSKPFVDMDRIGVHGWSFGGFMTTSLMVNQPDVFKVGAAGGPVIDWKYYEAMYGERYMDTPQENPEGYEMTSLLPKVNQLEGRLLMIHGAIDPTVVWQNSLTFVRACVEEGVQLDYFAYPRHEHNVRGADRVHLMEKITMYFDDFL